MPKGGLRFRNGVVFQSRSVHFEALSQPQGVTRVIFDLVETHGVDQDTEVAPVVTQEGVDGHEKFLRDPNLRQESNVSKPRRTTIPKVGFHHLKGPTIVRSHRLVKLAAKLDHESTGVSGHVDLVPQ